MAAEEVAEEEIDENSAENRVDEDRISNKEVEEQPNFEIEQPNSELVRKKFFILRNLLAKISEMFWVWKRFTYLWVSSKFKVSFDFLANT